MEPNDKISEQAISGTNGGNVRSAIIAVIVHAMIPIVFIAFSLCIVPLLAGKTQQFDIAPQGNIMVLFNISSLLSDHIFICLGILYILLTFDAAICLILFRMEKKIWASVWSWIIIICESAAMLYCVGAIYDFLKVLLV
jgi:hypothetical protein